ncbi:hypothetical protein DFJ58DRAFT_883639 [Suillus subalutaceus]|uniref:uncharacterized protein n=1 Tax=Suillus subalutaceus TaxID=48586 RepID=UPI001B8716E2|nr:uncharacterized protein DFJ58DRAFT_883639 [Suillus subalutaceus]KAG1853430.1 hypothetical protein DFJ58DRAFT_883639 [Suillus subalutaceus]
MIPSSVGTANMLRVPVVQHKSSSHSRSEPPSPSEFLQPSSSGGLTKPYRQPSASRGTPFMNARALSGSAVPTKSRPEKRSRPSAPLPTSNNSQTARVRPVRTPTPPPEKPLIAILPPPLPKSLHALNAHPPAIFSGNFDLYGMYLPFLVKAYLPQGSTSPDYAAVYDTILAYQSKHDYTARCFLSVSSDAGRAESASVFDPMMERPFDVMISNLKHRTELTFTSSERASFLAPDHSPVSPGVIGQVGLPPQCGVKNAKGIWKMKRVWVGEGEGELITSARRSDSSTKANPDKKTSKPVKKELFEGYFSFSVSYDQMYRKAGHGDGSACRFAFWGVRAMKDNYGEGDRTRPGEGNWSGNEEGVGMGMRRTGH